jgi:hypothetical protein
MIALKAHVAMKVERGSKNDLSSNLKCVQHKTPLTLVTGNKARSLPRDEEAELSKRNQRLVQVLGNVQDRFRPDVNPARNERTDS